MRDLSIIVPTHNRRSFLPGLLASLAGQDYPADAWELILVDDGSSDDTRAYLEAGAGPRPRHTTCLFQSNAGAGTARNYGAQTATGRALLFLDDDMIATPQLVHAHAEAHLAHNNAVVIGHMTVPTQGRSPWMAWEDAQMIRHYAALDSSRRLPGPRDFFSGNCSVSAALFRAIGGYNTTLKRTEDVELGYRLADAGAHFYYRRDASSHHLGLHSYAGWVRNARTYGASDVRLAWEQGHTELQTEIFRWFYLRKRPNQYLVRLCGVARRLETPLIGLLHAGGALAYRLGRGRVAEVAYSGIYNLAYWMALSDALGHDRFWAGIHAAQPGQPPGGSIAARAGEKGS